MGRSHIFINLLSTIMSATVATSYTLSEKCLGIFACLCLVCFAVQYLSRTKQEITTTDAFKKFQRMWLVVYLLAMCGDWLQGPFVYALYDSYGFSKEQIAHLFIAGFGSSMIFGTFVGSLADKFGRRRMSIAYGAIYAASCVTKLYNNFWMLMLGRILSGVATSLLFSSFESWMTSEHMNRQFSPAWLSQTFSYATFGNSLVAIGRYFSKEKFYFCFFRFAFYVPFVQWLGGQCGGRFVWLCGTIHDCSGGASGVLGRSVAAVGRELWRPRDQHWRRLVPH